MMKKMLLGLLTLLLPSMALAATYNGTPTPAANMATKKDANGCYQISSAEDLYGFAAIVNGGEASACGKLMDNIVVNENVLDADGNLKDAPDGGFKVWTPIGTEDKPFSGKFDGNNKKISGLYFNDDSKYYVGLFGYVSGGTGKNPVSIKDVGVVDSYFKGRKNVGGLLGEVDGTAAVTNSYNNGSVIGYSCVGGLVGYAYDRSTVYITNSYNGGDVEGEYSVGGLLGCAESGSTVSITNSYNNGSVMGSGDFVGGLLGYAHDYSTVTITNSYNNGSVTGSGRSVGGLVCIALGTISITNSYSAGKVNGNADVGGLLCYASSSATVRITNSFALEGSAGKLIGDASSVTETSSGFASELEFTNGTVAYALHNWCEKEDGSETCKTDGLNGSIWGQSVGTDEYPLLGKALTDKDGKAFKAYSVTYNLNGGFFSNYALDFYVAGVGKESLPTPVQPGYEFLGWYTDENFSGSWVTSIGSSETEGKTFYAKWKWDGSIKLVGDCYEIYNADGLYKFADIVNGTNGETATPAACGKLMKDIVVNENVLSTMFNADKSLNTTVTSTFKSWIPIGTSSRKPFSGTFDGSGHTISGLYFNDDSKYYVGLFGYVSGGTAKEPVTIKDVGVVDSYIKGYNAVGGLLGWASSSAIVNITNSYNVGSVTGSGNEVGGLLGGAYGSVSITNSYNVGSVTGSGNEVGGLLGGAYGSVSITNSYNVGSVTGSGNSVGGLLGCASSSAIVSITNSYSGGKVNGGYYVGGLLGGAYGSVSITNSYSAGKVNGSNDVGGLLGWASSSAIVSITNSVALEGSAGKLVGDGIVSTTSSGFAFEDEFKNGTVAYALHNWCEKEDGSTTCKSDGMNGSTWGQSVGTDKFPLLGKALTGKDGNALVAYSITYNLNGGAFSKYEPDFYFDGVGKDSLPTPVRPGPEFLGWYTDENLSGDAVTKIEKSEAGAKTFYAKWKTDIDLVNDCYEIHTADGLYQFAQIVNGEHTTIARNTSACGKLMEDIYINGSVESPLLEQLEYDGNENVTNDDKFKSWTPIGTSSNPFRGSFDGNGHTISGLYFNDDSKYYVGLFGYVSGGTAKVPVSIKDVGVVDSYIKGQNNVGGLLGYASSATVSITNSYSGGKVNGGYYVGGLLGGAYGSVSITNSYSAGKVNGSNDVGGLLGYASSSATVSITNSYNSGSVTGSGNFVGGLLGYASSATVSITNSYSAGEVNGSYYVGGLLGYASSATVSITNSYNSGSVTGSGNFVGGLLGYASSATVSITNSYSAGKVNGSNDVGGLLGGAYGSVSITNSYSAGKVNGSNDVGGLLGYASSSATVSITNSYNSGSVTGSGNFVGGLLGYANDGSTVSITNGYALDGSAGKLVGNRTVSTTSSRFAFEDEFKNGTVAYTLHNWCEKEDGSTTCKSDGMNGSTWGQSVGTDEFPLLGKDLTDKEGNAFVAYSIVYNLNGGSFSKYETDFYLRGVGKDPLPKPVFVGHTFLGWYTDENFSGSPVTSIGLSEKEDKVFYAKWRTDIELVNDCYEIYTADGLYQFAQIVNGEHTTIAKNTYARGKLMEDIYVNGDVNTPLASMLNEDGTVKEGMDVKFWTPIGTEKHPFSGSFDGNGKKISGLYFNNTNTNYVGLFGYVSGGTAKEPVTINGVGVEDSYIKGLHYVGGLLGKASSSAIVSITDSYSGVDVNGSYYVSGLLGYAESDSKVSITNSYNVGNVTGSDDVSGLVGYAESDSKVSITNSYNVGSVTGSGDEVGGLLGKASSSAIVSITNSYSGGKVNGGYYVGGLLGGAYGSVSITNSYSGGKVNGGYYVGGLLGKASSSAIVSITNSYSGGDVNGNYRVGGLLGDANSSATVSITNSFAKTGSADALVGDGTASTTSSGFASEDEFKNGTVAYALHEWCEKDGDACKANGANGAVWGQHVGHDVYPVLSNTYDPSGNLLPGEVKIDLDYVLNEGSIATGTVSTHTYGTKTVLPVPTRDGYAFDGWYESANFAGDKVESISADAKNIATSQTVDGKTIWKKKYYAKWANLAFVNACYEIYNADGLYEFAQIVNGKHATIAKNTAACGKLMKDIVVNEHVLDYTDNLGNVISGCATSSNCASSWATIGAYTSDGAKAYSGSFDGNGHTISGLYEKTTYNYVGFFSAIKGAKISNLGIVDSYFYGPKQNNGALVGISVGKDTIEACFSKSFVDGVDNVVGGLVGRSSGDLIIKNSHNEGHVRSTKTIVGGLVGFQEKGTLNISESYNIGFVNGSYNVGGLVGFQEKGTLNISESYNVGSIEGKVSEGGLVGRADAELTIVNAWNVGAISGTGAGEVGGLVGHVYSGNTSVMNSYNVGSLSISSPSETEKYLGGLVARASGSLSVANSYSLTVPVNGDVYDGATKAAETEFHDGTVAYALHDWCETYAADGKTCAAGGANGAVWGQHVGHDAYPVLSNTYDDAGNLLPGVVKFDLDYVLNGGVNAEGAVATYVYGKETVLPVPARAGYAFEGWYESAGFSDGKVESISADAKITATSQSVNENTVWTKKYYAKWSDPIEYTVTYNNVNGAINTNPAAYTVETEKINLSALARDGYKFLGWFDGKGDDANEVKKIAGGETGNVILYARWIETYEIKVAVNDSKMGTVSGAGSYEYGAEITLVATAADGYKFSNWEDDAKASATRKVTVSKAASYKANFEKVAASSSSAKQQSSSSVIPGSDPESGSSTKPASSSSKKVAASSSSAKQQSSSSVIPGSDPESGSKPRSSSSAKLAASSSSAKRNSSSSAKKDAIVASAKVPMFSVTVMGRNLQIAGAPVGEKIAILDMQGRVLSAGLASTGRVDAANFNVAMPRSGSYMVRIGNQVQRVNVK